MADVQEGCSDMLRIHPWEISAACAHTNTGCKKKPHTRAHALARPRTRAHSRALSRTLAHSRAHARTCAHMRAHARAHAHTHTRTHTHTDTVTHVHSSRVVGMAGQQDFCGSSFVPRRGLLASRRLRFLVDAAFSGRCCLSWCAFRHTTGISMDSRDGVWPAALCDGVLSRFVARSSM